jgi:ABC-type Fe3+ transport system substrate-binding protein
MAAISTPMAMFRDAPHPNAARLLMAWMFSPEGQRRIAATGRHPVMPDIGNAAGLPDDFDLPLHTLHWSGFADFPEYLARNREIFGT